MLKHRSGRRLLAALAMLCAFNAVAEEEAPERFVQNERDHTAYIVNADGSYVEQREWALKVLKEQALEAVKEASISYSTSIQKAEVLQAYTLKPDGRRIDVPKSNYQVQTNGGKGDGGPVFSDYSSLTVVFPELAVGDTVVFSYKLVASKPMFDGQFSVVDGFSDDTYYGDGRISIDAPVSLQAQYQAWNLKQTREETKDGRRLLEWSYSNTAPKKNKDDAAAVYDIEKSIAVAYSTFRSYADIADAYGKRALPKAAVTPRIQKLADEIAAGKQQPRDVAKALYEWVSTSITYAGNCIGLGAVVPHDLDFILDNKMGDCKDHATLLQALLAAKGISSEQDLINSGNLYTLPKIPVASMVNHVFNYIPSLDVYADATAKGIPFGMLPIQSAGKPILPVGGDRKEARTPAWPLGSNRQRMSTVLKIQPDGSVTGKVKVELNGMYAIAARAGFRDVSKDTYKDVTKNFFQNMGLIASGTFTSDDPKPLLDTYSYSSEFEVKEMLPIPGAFRIAPAFFNFSSVAHFASSAAGEIDEKNDTSCVSGYSEEEYVYEFPEQVKVVAVPPDLAVAGDALDYKATYELKGNVLKVKRVFDDRTPGSTCTPAFNKAYKEFTQKVLPNLKAQVIYQ